MEIPIAISKDKVSQFLEYLNLEIKRSGSGGYSTADVTAEGAWAEKMSYALQVSGDLHPALWTIRIEPDGALAPIDVAVVADAAPDGWERAAEAVVRNALSAAFSERKDTVLVRREFAYQALQLEGEYYIDDFRIAPSEPTSNAPLGMGEEVLVIDLMSSDIGGNMAAAVGLVRARELASLLSVFLGIGLYEIPIEKRWVYDSDTTCRHLQLGHRSTTPRPASIPPRGTECRSGTFKDVDRHVIDSEFGEPDAVLRCPSDIVRLFRRYKGLNAIKRKAYQGAAVLYQLARVLGRDYPTVEMAYAIAAVDSLNLGAEKNTEGFADIVTRYCPFKRSDVKEMYGRIRSAHFHSGDLPGGERRPVDLGRLLVLTQDHERRLVERYRVRASMRHVLIRWLLDHGQQNSTVSEVSDATVGRSNDRCYSQNMADVVNIAEIHNKFPAEWVLVEDPQTNESLEVEAGNVLYHGQDRDEVYRKAVELRPKSFAILYTGTIPEDTAIVL